MTARAPLLVAGLAVAAGITVIVGLTVGPAMLPPGKLLAGLSSAPHSDHAWIRVLLIDVRLPRVLVALLVGGALAVSGCILQTLFRNPLSDPAVLGVSGGAALGAQAVIFFGLANAAPWLVPVSALAGASVTTLALISLTGFSKQALETLLLGGIALAQLAAAASTLFISLAVADYTVARRLLQWMLGTLDGRTWMHVAWGVAPILLGVAWSVYRARELDALLLGDVTAAAVGVDVGRLRRELVAITALLCGASVAIGGVVSFVGLVVPHLMRRLVGARHVWLLPACLLGGGSLVIAADVVARIAIAPEELQLGVITAAIGAPWFIALVNRRLREGRV